MHPAGVLQKYGCAVLPPRRRITAPGRISQRQARGEVRASLLNRAGLVSVERAVRRSMHWEAVSHSPYLPPALALDRGRA